VRTRLVSGLIAVTLVPGCTGSGEAEAPPIADEVGSEAETLLARSIQYHDPQGEWSTFSGTLEFEEMRPDGSSRRADVSLDVPGAGFTYSAEVDGRVVWKTVAPGECSALIDQRAPSPEEVETFRLRCDQIERSRNYYLYLWGLPMKLRDPGTRLDPEVVRTQFQGTPVDQIRVTYDAEVGQDTWYVYFEPESARMVGYRFYHDESVGDGEYITLEDEFKVSEMRLPARRRWFVNADDRFLGEDVLRSASVAPLH